MSAHCPKPLMPSAIQHAQATPHSPVAEVGSWTSIRTQLTTHQTSLTSGVSRTPSMTLTGCFLRGVTTTSRTTLQRGRLILHLITHIKPIELLNILLFYSCVKWCTDNNYDYAGLQYSSQCICSNAGPPGISDESKCTYGCAGDKSIKMCGGLGYINIFHTDAHKSTIDDFGCGSTAQDTYYQKWFDDMGHCGVSGNGGRALFTFWNIFPKWNISQAIHRHLVSRETSSSLSQSRVIQIRLS